MADCLWQFTRSWNDLISTKESFHFMSFRQYFNVPVMKSLDYSRYPNDCSVSSVILITTVFSLELFP